MIVTIDREGELYVAHCADPELASQGASAPEALRNLAEALELLEEPATLDQPRAGGLQP